MNRPWKRCSRRSRARGLATLELVLCLPILLAVMALMINFGTAQVWKLRGSAAARHILWSSRSPRLGVSFPRPRYWQAPKPMSRGGDVDAAVLEDPRVDQPVARGPTLPYGTTVNRDLLSPARGMTRGGAAMQSPFPLLRRLGNIDFGAYTELLDDKWQFWRMGLSVNRLRRIPVIYALARAPTTYSTAYVQAVLAILRAPFRADLYPLDRDDEFIAYSRRFLWGSGAPDFHPRLHHFCDLDPATAQREVNELIDRIRGKRDEPRVPGVPEVMTRAFINLYNRVIQELQNRINATPPPPPDQIAAMQAEISQLQGRIATLTAFLQTLQ